MKKILPVFLLALLILGCSKSIKNDNKLVVVLVVDQMRADYLDRFDENFTRGLRRIIDSGHIYTNAYLNYSATKTSTGHATISTGLYPKNHGIVDNNWFDRKSDKAIYSCFDPNYPILGNENLEGRSPANLLTKTIGDYLKDKSSQSVVASIALKDRAAISMGGQHPDAAYWYDYTTGKFTTSSYYADSLPAWVRFFNNESGSREGFFNKYWMKFGSESQYKGCRADNYKYEYDGINTAFPHYITGNSDQPDPAYYDELSRTPFGDKVMFWAARRLANAYKMGQDDNPDLLFIGCSSADPVGHRFGPYSQEVLDYYLQLDDYISHLFDSLTSWCGEDRFSLILTSDHGVATIPEYAHEQGLDAQRISYEQFKNDLDTIYFDLAIQYDLGFDDFKRVNENIYLNRNTLEKLSPEKKIALIKEAKERLKQLSFIAEVYTSSELSQSNGTNDPYLKLFQNNYNADRCGDLVMRLKENYIVSSDPYGTTHGSAYGYDRHIPLVIYRDSYRHESIDDTVSVTDIAPTIAKMLGLKDLPFDGQASIR